MPKLNQKNIKKLNKKFNGFPALSSTGGSSYNSSHSYPGLSASKSETDSKSTASSSKAAASALYKRAPLITETPALYQ